MKITEAFNFGKEKFKVKKGDQITQLICKRMFYPDIEEVRALDDSERDSGHLSPTVWEELKFMPRLENEKTLFLKRVFAKSEKEKSVSEKP